MKSSQDIPATNDAGIPRQIGRFRIEACVGSGAFGTVLRAHDPQLDRTVALKVLRPGALASRRAVERFLREARAAAQLCHPHVVPVYEAGCEGLHHYLAAAYIEGRPLTSFIEEGPFRFRRAARIARELAEALAHAHGLGIVHRDVKPANIMLDTHDAAHLMDFGLAYRQDEAEKLTQDGAILGTPAYMAPEQASGRQEEVQPASDQYSLGVLLYEMLSGRRPFTGPPEAVLFSAIHAEPPPLRSQVAGLPRDLETICLKAMAKRPEDRYATCQELADDLRRWLEGEPILARRLGWAERLGRWCWREPILAASMAMAGLALTSLVIVATTGILRYGDLIRREAEARRQAEELKQREAEARLQAEERQQAAAVARRQAEEQRQQTRTAIEDAESARQAEVLAANLAGDEERRLRTALDELQQKQEAARKAEAKAKEQESLLEKALRDRELLAPRSIAVPPLRVSNRSTPTFSPDGRFLAVAVPGSGAAAIIHVLDLLDNPMDRKITVGEGEPIRWLAFHPNGKDLVSVCTGRKARFWELAKGWGTGPVTHGNWMTQTPLALSPDGQRLAAVNLQNTVVVWDLNKGQPAAPGLDHTERVTEVVFDPLGQRLATATTAGRVTVWELASRRQVTRCENSIATASALAFSPDGKRLLGAGAMHVRVWELPSGREAILLDSRGPAAFQPNGKYLFTAVNGKDIRVWDAQTAQGLLTLPGHLDSIVSLAVSTDGNRLLSAGLDGTVKSWELAPLLVEVRRRASPSPAPVP